MKIINCVIKCIIIGTLVISNNTFAQSSLFGNMFTITSKNSMYPCADKPAQPAFQKNHALVFVPKFFNANKPFSIQFFFHGFNNSIETCLQQFKLDECIYAAKKNCILVLPEAAAFANDGYAGNWEKPNNFNGFMADVLTALQEKKVLSTQTKSTDLNIGLSAYSGGSRVMMKVIEHSSYNIQSVIFYDAFYSDGLAILKYIKRNPAIQIINLHTDKPYTLQASAQFKNKLKQEHLLFVEKNEKELTYTELSQQNILIIRSYLTHNDVCVKNDYVSKFWAMVK